MSELHAVQKQKTKKLQIKPYSAADLAEIYGLKWGVMNQWLKYLQELTGERIGRFYTPKQVAIIFGELGVPDDYELEKNEK